MGHGSPVVHLVGAQETNYPWGFENRLIPAFEAIGCEVIGTDYRKRRSELHRLMEKQADFVLVCKGEGIPPQIIRSAPCPTVLWYAEQVGSLGASDQLAEFRRRELAYNIAAFDYVFSHDQGNLGVYEQLGARRVGWLATAAVDIHIQKRLHLDKVYDVTFVGTITPRRKQIIDEISKSVSVNVTNIWEPSELNRTFNQSKIVLNIHLSDLLNTETRIAEVLGAGAFLVTEKISSSDLVTDGVHAVEVEPGNTQEFVSKIIYFLEHDEERERIAAAGHDHIRAHHTLEIRAKQLIQMVRKDGVRKMHWPGEELGVLHDSSLRRTADLELFYKAIENSVKRV
jgi:spore maturation protein CgeB